MQMVSFTHFLPLHPKFTTDGICAAYLFGPRGLVNDVSPAPPKEVAPIDGLVEFTIATCTPGATVIVSVDYGSSLPADAEYWKVGIHGSNWMPLSREASLSSALQMVGLEMAI